MERMTLVSKRELLKVVRDRYWRASKKKKRDILDEFVANTGYHRKYALALLHGRTPPPPAGPRGRKHIYTQEVTDALTCIWNICDCIASRRLQPFLPEMVSVLTSQGELHASETTRQLLLTMSRSTIDRLLKPARQRMVPHGRSTTKPGQL